MSHTEVALRQYLADHFKDVCFFSAEFLSEFKELWNDCVCWDICICIRAQSYRCERCVSTCLFSNCKTKVLHSNVCSGLILTILIALRFCSFVKIFLLMFAPFFLHLLLTFSQAAGFAGCHQWEGRKHRPAGVILLQTKEIPRGSGGSEEGERQADAPAQTAGTSSTYNHQAIYECL